MTNSNLKCHLQSFRYDHGPRRPNLSGMSRPHPRWESRLEGKKLSLRQVLQLQWGKCCHKIHQLGDSESEREDRWQSRHFIQVRWLSSILKRRHEGEWQVSSSGTPDGRGHLNKSRGTDWETWTFKDLFWNVWKSRGYTLPSEADDNKVCKYQICWSS